jgi:hypothetical protein
MSRAPYDRQRDLVDGLMDQTAGLYQLRAQVERLLARNIASTELALRMEQHLRKNGSKADPPLVRAAEQQAS